MLVNKQLKKYFRIIKKGEMKMKKIKLLSLILGLVLVLAACGNSGTAEETPAQGQVDENKDLIVGVAAGPYGDLFALAVQPGLEARGYNVEIREFSDYVQPNLALNNGEIQINLFQHLTYLNNFKEEHNLDLSPVAFVPTAGAGIFSKTITSLDSIPEGTQVAISNDITNQARALRILQAAGLIKLDPNADTSAATPEDISENPLNLEIVPIEAPQTPRAIDSAGLSVVNGNYAIGAGLDLSTAIYTEQLEADLKNVIAIRTEDLDKQLGKDLLEIVKSDEYKAVLEDEEYIFYTFQEPDYQIYD